MLDNEHRTWYNPDIEENQEEEHLYYDSLSAHGYERAKDRTKGGGVVKTEKRIKKVWANGKRIENYEDDPKFQKYLMNVKSAGDASNELRVFGNDVYIFSSTGVLITVLNIPAKVLAQRGRRK